LGPGLLDLHAPSAAMAELAPSEVAVDVLRRQSQPGGQAFDDRNEPRAMRFPCCGEADDHAREPTRGLARLGFGPRAAQPPDPEPDSSPKKPWKVNGCEG